MLCEKCNKNEATFFYHENVNGNEKNYRLCAECAKSFEKETHFEDIDSVFGDIAYPFKSIDKLWSDFFGESGVKPQIREEKKCSCGMTLRELSSGGMVGCPECYETFGRELEESIKRIHGKAAHEGRTPMKYRAKLDIRRKIEALEKEQAEAIKAENYERAAEIRDMLKDMRAAEGGV